MSPLLPLTCVACGSGAAARARALCATCEARMPWLAACCPACALPVPCGAPCPATGQAFAWAWSAAAHRGVARRLVSGLKFRGVTLAADAIGLALATRAPDALLAGGVLVPVPADPWRRRMRGLDHSLLIAAATARHGGPAVRRLLRRRGAGSRQAGQARAVRLAGGRLAIAVGAPVPSRCVLVDDVHTTGASLDACARALLAAGAQEVGAITFARAIARSNLRP